MVFFIRNYLHAEFLAKYCSFANSGESQKKQHVNWQKKLQIFWPYLFTDFRRGYIELFYSPAVFYNISGV